MMVAIAMAAADANGVTFITLSCGRRSSSAPANRLANSLIPVNTHSHAREYYAGLLIHVQGMGTGFAQALRQA
ncbi:hypothetical protein AB5I41_18740 [Sphingomonas sp. MMS24-JH45]